MSHPLSLANPPLPGAAQPFHGPYAGAGPVPGYPAQSYGPGHAYPAHPYAYAAPHDPSNTRAWFSGLPGEFFMLLVRGALLQVLTFGFYRFWLLTDIRRHLWSNTRIGDESLEYTGTGKELLFGFLIAIVILAPFNVASFIVAIYFESFMAFTGVALTPILYVFGQYAAYRARRYRATRTIFRGVRFWMGGSAWSYAGRALLWDLLTVLSLGLAYPWRLAALERYKMRNTYFGDLKGDFVATGGDFFRRGVWMWCLTIGLPLLCGVAALAFSARAGGAVEASSAGLGVGLVLALIIGPLLYPLFLATRIRWQLEGVRFGAAALANNLPKGEVFLSYFKLFAASLGLSVVFGLLVSGLSAALFGTAGDAMQTAMTQMNVRVGAGLALIALLYLMFLQGIGVLKRYFVERGIWATVVFTTSVAHLDAADHVRGVGTPASFVGEGLADALDVGAF